PDCLPASQGKRLGATIRLSRTTPSCRSRYRLSTRAPCSLSPDISYPLGGKPSSPFNATQFSFSQGCSNYTLHVTARSAERAGLSSYLKKVAALGVHFSLWQRKMQARCFPVEAVSAAILGHRSNPVGIS